MATLRDDDEHGAQVRPSRYTADCGWRRRLNIINIVEDDDLLLLRVLGDHLTENKIKWLWSRLALSGIIWLIRIKCAT